MTYINDLKAKGFFKTRIKLAEVFDAEQDPALRALYEGAWIDMREPNEAEMMAMQGPGKGDMAAIGKLLPDCMVDWSLQASAGEKASREEVVEVLKASGTLWSYTLEEWGKSLPLARRSAARSAKSPAPSSGASGSSPS
jgi:hypothetical protein